MTGQIITKREGAVLHVTLNRPDKKNAITTEIYRGMTAALNEADSDDKIGAVVITGSGGCFTAGNDVGDFLNGTRDKDEQPGLRFIRTIAACNTPIVAAVDGVAVGVGTTMLFHCDLIYASPTAKFRMPFVDLGLVPEAASSLLVPLRVGMAKATEMLMLGDAFNADDALRLGVINAIVPAEKLVDHALEQATRLAAKPRNALAQTRRLLRGDRADVLKRIDDEIVLFTAALQSDEARAAFMAFLSRAK